jgi:hypothetical protein
LATSLKQLERIDLLDSLDAFLIKFLFCKLDATKCLKTPNSQRLQVLLADGDVLIAIAKSSGQLNTSHLHF